MKKFFEGSSHAVLYAKHRPMLPQFVASKIIKFMKERNCTFNFLLDVGCGNGQSTEVFSPYFAKVLGIDTSSSQIEIAKQNNLNKNVTFEAGDGENLPVPDNTVDLIASTMAVHWFDFPIFFKECNRVLKENGCLFLCGHDTPYFYPKSMADQENVTDLIEISKAAMRDFSSNLIYDVRANHLCNHYVEIFDLVKSNKKERETNLIMETSSSLAEFVSYLSTWSPYQRYLKERKESVDLEKPSNYVDLLEVFTSNLKEMWNMNELHNRDILLSVFREYFVILSEKPF